MIDTAPIIYVLEGHAKLGPRFHRCSKPTRPAGCASRSLRSPSPKCLPARCKSGDEALARRYRAVLESWPPVPLDVDIAESAARLRASLRLKPADAVQAASALAVNAAAIVTHDRDFSRVKSLRVIQ